MVTKSLLKMNQQRINTALTKRCKCCLRERPTTDLWSEHFVQGEMENYGFMVKKLCLIPDGSETERICYPCIGRLKDAVDFKKQVEVAQSFLEELVNYEDSDVEVKMDYFLERHFNKIPGVRSQLKPKKIDVSKEHGNIENVRSHFKPIKMEVAQAKERDEESNYTDIEYLEMDGIEEEENASANSPKTKKRTAAKNKKAPVFNPLGGKLIRKVGKRYCVSDPNNKQGKKGVKKRVPPEENKLLQLQLEKQKLQDNLVALLLSTNATPIKLKNDTGYRCGFCTDVYLNAGDLKKHTLQFHTDDEKRKYMADVDMYCFVVKLDITNHRCNICGESLDDYEGVWQHLKDHGVNVHLNIKNQIIPYKLNDNGMHKCFVCLKEFVYFRAISTHMNTHLRNYVCESCGTGFLTKRAMLLHARLHKEGDYKCKFCDKHYNVMYKLRVHEHNAHTNRKEKNVCGFCGERFNDHNTKARHLETEHGVKRTLYQCDSCDKVLLSRTSLKKHFENVHHRMKNYQCPVCDKECYQKYDMEKHIANIHNDKKHLVCITCSKVFSKSSLLRLHQRMHEKDKTFICKLCKDQFERKAGVLSHLRSRHEIPKARDNFAELVEVAINLGVTVDKDVKHECLLCHQNFSDKEELIFHLKTAHGVATENFKDYIYVNVGGDYYE